MVGLTAQTPEAPIAERTQPIRLADLMALGSDARVEVINGVIRAMAPTGELHNVIGGILFAKLISYVLPRKLGMVYTDGVIFLMNADTQHLRDSFVPDVSYVRKEDLPADRNLNLPLPGVPTLAVEIFSPGDDAEALLTKVRTYLALGTSEVWVIYPKARELHQYRQGDAAVITYQGTEIINTERLFPGLELTTDSLFALPDLS